MEDFDSLDLDQLSGGRIVPAAAVSAAAGVAPEDTRLSHNIFKTELKIFEETKRAYEEVFGNVAQFHMAFALPIDPEDPFSVKMVKLLYANRKVTKDDFESLYRSLWHTANIRGIDFVNEQYENIIKAMQANWGLFDPAMHPLPPTEKADFLGDSMRQNWPPFDPTFSTPITAWGFFADAQSRCVRPVRRDQTILIFGAVGADQYEEPGIYRVNINKNDEPDLIADMNNPAQLALIPEKQFKIVWAENIPALDFYGPAFFKSAHRILQDDGQLLFRVDLVPFAKDAADNFAKKVRESGVALAVFQQSDYFGINMQDFFLRHGFSSRQELRIPYCLVEQKWRQLEWAPQDMREHPSWVLTKAKKRKTSASQKD